MRLLELLQVTQPVSLACAGLDQLCLDDRDENQLQVRQEIGPGKLEVKIAGRLEGSGRIL